MGNIGSWGFVTQWQHLKTIRIGYKFGSGEDSLSNLLHQDTTNISFGMTEASTQVIYRLAQI